MTEDDFFQLPATVAIRILFDALGQDQVATVLAREKPKLPLPPKYDAAIYRREGVMWASECDIETLRYWRGKYQESADKGGEWADKDRKRVETMDRWITWREVYPDATWGGERDRKHGVSRGPSSKPKVYPTDRSKKRAAEAPKDDGVNPDADVPY